MIKFTAYNADLIRFFEKSAAKGVVIITPTDKMTRHFFGHFYLEAKDDTLTVMATDSGEQRMYISHHLSGVGIEEEGTIGITDVTLILDILRSIPTKRKISFIYDDKKRSLFVETSDEGTYYGYRVRQAEETEQMQIALENSTVGVGKYFSIHSFEEGKPKITMDGKTAFYDTVVKFKKTELSKVVRDSVNLTKDQNLKISMADTKIKFRTGRKADGVNSEMVLEKEIINPIKFEDVIITNLHPIVSHLFNDITFYCRFASDDSLKFWIKSKEGNIELNFGSSSA